MTPLVVLGLALQGAPDVDASVSRTRLGVGDEVVVTVRVRSPGREPVRIDIPPPAGFALVGTRELTDVALSDQSSRVRTTVRELRLRAERPGRAALAGIRVRQGQRVVAVNAIALDVDSAGRPGVVLSDVVRALVERSPPPGDTVHVALLASADTIVTGEQLDLVALAWFPRDLRLRLRRPPLLGFKTPDRVWAYPLFSSGDVAASRRVRGRWFDAFVAHQVVFPLRPGPLAVEPARIDFALPVSYAFFSREDRYSLRSESLHVAVRALPGGGPRLGDPGVAARELTLERRVVSPDVRVGEPLDVEAALAGAGNVALWPEPHIDWPAALRAYPGETTIELDPPGGPVQGRKTFRYLVVADSPGVVVLPELRYPYYDLTAGAYRVAHVAAQAMTVAPGAEAQAARALPPLAPSRGRAIVDRMMGRLDGWVWSVLALIPPLVVLVARRRRRADARGRGDPEPPAGLAALERRFLFVLASHVPDAALRDGGGLAPALRATGIDSATAEHVTRVRDRLRAARYGPRGARGVPGLAEDIVKVLGVLQGEPVRRRGRRAVTSALLLAVVIPAAGATGQSAEALYDAGALRAAADSFAARAERAPRVAEHWYNLGATLYRAGADGKATVAWTRAARLAPRDQLVRRARRLLPAPEAASEPLLVVGPATPTEYALVALAAWAALWGAVLIRRRASATAVFALVMAAAVVPGVIEWRRRAQPVAVVLAAGTAVRAAPYGGAATFLTLDAGAAVLLERRYGGWVRIHRDDGVHGWVLGGEVAEL